MVDTFHPLNLTREAQRLEDESLSVLMAAARERRRAR